jgi:DNA polymerase-3 subunit delta'
VLEGAHPDVVVVEREGAAISIGMAQEITRAAVRSPVEGHRKVLVLNDFQLVKEAGPALLKTIEEPPASTVFIVMAEHVPYELVTIASRCVRIDFSPLAPSVIAGALRADGMAAEQAEELAIAADGRLDRARLLAVDPEFGLRRRAWQAIPDRLDGAGATAATIADELIGLLEHSVTPLRTMQEQEVAALQERNAKMSAVNGKPPRGRAGAQPGLRELEERHKREVRRQRTDELRAGLAALAGAYRDRLSAGGRGAANAIEAVGLIQKLNENLLYNPSEQLQLQALLVGLGRLAGHRAAAFG